jgi:hypothetical protein
MPWAFGKFIQDRYVERIELSNSGKEHVQVTLHTLTQEKSIDMSKLQLKRGMAAMQWKVDGKTFLVDGPVSHPWLQLPHPKRSLLLRLADPSSETTKHQGSLVIASVSLLAALGLIAVTFK